MQPQYKIATAKVTANAITVANKAKHQNSDIFVFALLFTALFNSFLFYL